jgi:hypothetical protein
VKGYTALHLAARRRDGETAKVLLEWGANPAAVCKEGQTARDMLPDDNEEVFSSHSLPVCLSVASACVCVCVCVCVSIVCVCVCVCVCMWVKGWMEGGAVGDNDRQSETMTVRDTDRQPETSTGSQRQTQSETNTGSQRQTQGRDADGDGGSKRERYI